MSQVIERLGSSVSDDGKITYQERIRSHEDAERIAGCKLDRRRNYAIINGEVCESAGWSQACSGCYEGYESNSACGIGCHECGYTGRRRCAMWVPLGVASDV